MLRLLSIPSALLVLLIAAMAWSSSSADKRSDFVFVNRADIITLDTNQMSYLQDMRIAYGIWEGLYVYDPMTLQPIPGCANADASPDKKVWTFHINPNAKWSNGDPVTANDFIFAWRRMLESPGEYTYLHYYIKGAEQYLKDFAEGKKPDFATVGEEALDAKTLRVTLANPVPFFLDLAAFPPFFPLHEKSMAKFAKRDPETGRVQYDPQFTRPPNLVTNGPFILSRWDFKRRLILTRNPFYWNPDSVKSNTIEMAVVEDSLTQLLRYDAGLVDWVSAVPTDLAAEMKIKGRPDLRTFTGFGTEYILLMMAPKLRDGRDNPLADPRIRHAMAMAIDKKTIVETITRMGEIPALTFVPPNCFPGYEPQKGIEYNPKRAKELLAEAGYPNGGVLPGVTYLYTSTVPSSKEVAQNLTRQWSEKLGLKIPLEAAEPKIRRQRINDKDFSLAVSDWIGDYGDASTFTDMYQTHSDNNNSGWGSAEYDKLVVDAAREPDEQKRLRMLEKAESILLAETPIIPLFYITNQYLFKDNVHGINLSPRNMTMLKAVHVDRGAARYMLNVILWRVAQFPLILAIIYLITFFFVWVAPGSPFGRDDRKLNPQAEAALKEKFHAGSWQQFLAWYPYNILCHGDFGPSMQYGEWSVNDILKVSLPVSITLGLFAMIIAMLAGTAIGIAASVHRGGMLDWFSLSVALIGISVPSFVVAALLLALFAGKLGWFPIGGWGSMRDMILPGVALSLAPMAYIARLTRVSMIDVLSSDYVRTARAKGVSRTIVIWKHCLRNAFLPVLSYLGPAAASTLTGSFVVEKVFSIPGLGQHFVNSIQNRDRTLILGTVMVYSVFLLVFNLLVDIGYTFVDPRIDLEAKAAGA